MWDCHFHVFENRAPMSPVAKYRPPEATLIDWKNSIGVLGIAKGVLVQPSIYGTNNDFIYRILREANAEQDWLRGVLVAGRQMSSRQIRDLSKFGVRGVRINMLQPGGCGPTPVLESARQMVAAGWNVQLVGDPVQSLDLAEYLLESTELFVVLDHFGMVDPNLHSGELNRLWHCLDSGRVAVKLSGGYRLTQNLDTLGSHVVKLAETWLDKLVWGSDWPHPDYAGPIPRPITLLNHLEYWGLSVAQREQILIHTPQKLYGPAYI